MTTLPFTITQAGLGALVDSSGAKTNIIQVGGLGLTSTPFVMAPTLTSLPGEYKRLDTISGAAVAEDIIHFVATDNSTDTYTVTGIGLYLTNGTLFGVFSLNAGDDALFQKASAATFLFAADITFQGADATLIQFGDSNFLNPPATTTTLGVVELATGADVLAEVDPSKAVTPASLAGAFVPMAQKGQPNGVASLDGNGRVPPAQMPPLSSIDTFTANSQAAMLALPATPGDFCQRTDLTETFVCTASPASTLANWTQFLAPGAPVQTVNGKIGQVVLGPGDVGAPPVGRQVTGGGLITGGGDMSADRVLQVLIASAADALAGQRNDVAVTPASLASILSALAATAQAGRRINTAGLASGGGDLNADRTITVTAATAADVEGLTDNTKALTAAALAGTLRSIGGMGYLRIPGTPLIIQWGNILMLGRFKGTDYQNFNQFKAFNISFPHACCQVIHSLLSNPDPGTDQNQTEWVSSWTKDGFTMSNENVWNPYQFSYLAIGY